MRRLITLEDFIDLYTKIKLRGLPFVLSKFNLNNTKRTRSAFNELNIDSAHSWVISKMHERWNQLITGNPKIGFRDFIIDFFKEKQGIKMLSLGSGNCFHELEFASHSNFSEIVCMDISDELIKNAKTTAKKNNLTNITFKVQDVYNYDFPENYFDIVFFHASLHHFKNIEEFLKTKVKPTLKSNGVLIMNEYVGTNRLQYPKHQISAINECLQLLPRKFKKRFKLNLYKNKYYGSGIIRMIMADPSECVDSVKIMPTIHNLFTPIYERDFGGNILIPALKDLGHHFVTLDDEKEKILEQLFKFEDAYLKQYKSDYVFGIYKNEAQ
ncbi:class I SAM-dependent methyltransferase [Pontimicrobium sp. SW4]|uniref:Class I SAM-dependent methyltransferase n=1 Tax=Pontimicrobium sp. SW4 TaxID=3153519 RepID=A0AAU7BQ50_9FLAO